MPSDQRAKTDCGEVDTGCKIRRDVYRAVTDAGVIETHGTTREVRRRMGRVHRMGKRRLVREEQGIHDF